MTIQQAAENIRRALKEYGAHTRQQDILEDVTDSFIERLARDSVEAKQDLRDLFSKSPVWNPELDALVINGTRTHNPDPNRITVLVDRILHEAICKMDGLQYLAYRQAMGFFEVPDLAGEELEESIRALNVLAPDAYKPGKKKSRVFKALCQALGVVDETQGSDFQKLYAQFADELTSKKLDFKLYVSINPAHFLTMSNPKGDDRGSTLTSCHSFNNTAYPYNCGCSGYARDKVTFIVFTVDDPTNPGSFNNRKTTRQIFAYRPGSGLLLQSRMYNTSGGVYGADKDSQLYRDLIQREISALECEPNLWKTYHSYDEYYSRYVDSGYGFGGYEDWIYDNFDGHISFRADCDMDTVKPLIVGTYGLCVMCGDEISEGMYCDDCVQTCDRCGDRCYETFPVYNPVGNEIYVCSRCNNEYFFRCDCCGEYHDREDMTWVGEDTYCNSCLEETCEQCYHCGEWHRREDMTRIVLADGREVYVCEECDSRYDYVTCPHCGDSVMIRPDGTCPTCGATIKEEEEAV